MPSATRPGDFGTGDDTRLTAASDAFDDAAALSTSLQSNERDAGGDSRREVISLIEDNMQQIERMRSDAARAASLLGSLTPPEGSVA